MIRRYIFILLFVCFAIPGGKAFSQQSDNPGDLFSGGDDGQGPDDSNSIYQYDPRLRQLFDGHPYYEPNSPQAGKDVRWHYSPEFGPGRKRYVSEAYPDIEGRVPDWAKKNAGLILPAELDLSLVADPRDPANAFMIRLEYQKLLQTCDPLSDILYENEFIEPFYYDIRVYGVMPPEQQSASGGCIVTENKPEARIRISRFEAEKIKHVRFYALYEIDRYDLKLEEDTVSLRPVGRSERIIVPKNDPNRLDPLAYRFYPERTVALFVAENGRGAPDHEQALDDFAQTRGLVPVKTDIDGPTSGHAGQRIYYYEDVGGSLFNALQEKSAGQAIVAGQISGYKTVRDVGGARRYPVEVDVYARLPHDDETPGM